MERCGRFGIRFLNGNGIDCNEGGVECGRRRGVGNTVRQNL